MAFPSLKIAVFVDGCFWHRCPVHGTAPKANADWWRAKLDANRDRDRDTDERLREIGWLSYRVWEHENPDAAAQRLLGVVTERKSAHRGGGSEQSGEGGE